ncbi:hypothetical protein FE391_17090 [Nonomuraea sp. KC401]|uniref:permease prefix domain 1-containing protein n=1 Tax=unclassified Nonomuraea TaxID=2593643 RepID=UPI0010FCF6D9|nr:MULTISPECIES: permease prefix domain 1-containing protein [unclassified Nonomuraea]NBE94898.1 hypothetical protein [Nonomuraea sp. K271]TLF72248.1 hypothetical protein FE391_17090 [Nonomuraea sp. KC401]
MRIDDYVADLDRALAGPHGLKRDMVVEARDSLTDTADALEAEGVERAEAERVAVAEFGEVAEIASGYQAELTASAGRRLGVLLFAGLPITVLMWSLLWRAYPPSDDTWAHQPEWYHTLSQLLDGIQLATGLYGGIALFALSRGARWMHRPRLVTRSLGWIVWASLPVTGGLGLMLSYGTKDPNSLAALPSLLANLVTWAVWGMQIYCAARCMRITRVPRPHAA